MYCTYSILQTSDSPTSNQYKQFIARITNTDNYTIPTYHPPTAFQIPIQGLGLLRLLVVLGRDVLESRGTCAACLIHAGDRVWGGGGEVGKDAGN